MTLLLATQKAQRRWLLAEKRTFPRHEPRCQYVGTCGGCNLQDLAYEHQLAIKQRLLAQAFQPLGITDIPLRPLNDPWRYRNKLELTFSRVQDTTALGLHARGSFWQIVDIADCWLAPEPLAGIVQTMREAVRRSGLPIYDVKQHVGFWRHLVLRYSRHQQQVALCVFTNDGPRAAVEQVFAEVQRAHPAVATAYWGINRRLSDVAAADTLELLLGSPLLREQIGPFLIDLHPLNFLQPCLAQAEQLYTTLIGWLADRQVRQAWDLYAGIGCIGFYLARAGAQVFCLESDPRNVAQLLANAQLNGLTTITALQGQVELHLQRVELPTPDCVVVDPPRAGLHKYALRALAQRQPRLLAYVSCNVATLIPNLQTLLHECPTYRIAAVQAFDMFPQTAHVETLVLLERSP